MSLKKVHDEQPKNFKFSDENIKKAEEILKMYPHKNKKSAVMPFLYLAQRQNNNWLPLAAILFIIFDLEIAFLFPWAISLGNLGALGYWSMMMFLGILTIGFIYEWKKGALEWE